MLFTLAMVVFVGGIIICFSQEFIDFFKKILEIKGAKIFLPLIIGSLLVSQFDYWILWFLYYYREVLTSIVTVLNYPFTFTQWGYPIILIALLTAISVIPVILLELFLWKRSYKHYQFPYLTSSIIWIVSSFVMVVTITI